MIIIYNSHYSIRFQKNLTAERSWVYNMSIWMFYIKIYIKIKIYGFETMLDVSLSIKFLVKRIWCIKTFVCTSEYHERSLFYETVKCSSEDYREGYMGIRCIFMRRDVSSWFFVYVMRVHVYGEDEPGSRACITWNNKWRIPKGICLTRRKVPHGHPRSAIHKS